MRNIEVKGEVLTAPGRRRRWSVEEKQRLLAEAHAAGGSISQVARRYGISRSLLLTWRRKQTSGGAARGASFVPVQVTPAPRLASSGMIAIALPGGIELRVDREVDGAALRRVLEALGGR